MKHLISLTLATFAVPLYAGSAALTGITAVADDAEGALTNPAGMTRLNEASFSIGGLVAYGLGDFVVDEQNTSMDGGNPKKGTSAILIPSLYYVRPFGERLRAGISLTVPSGFGAEYGSDWAGRYYTDTYSLVYIAVTPAVAYRLSDSLSIGGSLGINYTSSEAESSINTLVPGAEDGRLEAELSGVGFSASFGILWEPSESTRFGLVYTSDSEAELEGDAKLKNVGPVLDPVLDALDLKSVDLEIDNTLPQRVIAGVYHELSDDWSVTADILWMKFSEFGTTGVSLNDTSLEVDPPDIYDDIWGLTAGVTHKFNATLSWNVGGFLISQPVDDDDRTLSMRLDSMWGVGAGVTQKFDANRSVDINLTLVNYGEAPVDTGESVARGRIVGKNEDPWSVLFGITWHF